MRSGTFAVQVVAVLCACAAAQERPEPFSPGDMMIVVAGEPNDPNGAVPGSTADPNKAWDPATHLAADWDSIAVSMTSRLYNPDRQGGMVSKGPQWSMSLAAIIAIIDSNGLIATAQAPTSVLALDQDGQVVSRSLFGDSRMRFYRQPRSSEPRPGYPSLSL